MMWDIGFKTLDLINEVFLAMKKIYFSMQFFLQPKGQLISKANQSSRGFFQKTNENTLHSSKNKFIRSFFGRILGLTVCF